MTDGELLMQYVAGEQAAFELLVGRYVDMVHRAAERQLPGMMGEAEDVTQAVFLLLAKKAGGLRRRASVAGWLLEVTRLCAARARRSAQRRGKHEQEAGMQRVKETAVNAGVGELLDKAMASLSAREREVVILRHLQGRSLEEVAARLEISVEAATKRAQRGMSGLRGWFARRGAEMSMEAVAGLLAREAGHRAPAGAGGAASAKALMLAKQVSIGMMAVPAAWGVAAAVTVAVIGVGAAASRRRTAMPTPTKQVAVATTENAPVVVEEQEATLTGKTVLAKMDVLMDKAVGDALRAVGRPIETTSKGYAAYRMETNHVLAILRKAQADGALITPEWANVTFAGTDERVPESWIYRLTEMNSMFSMRQADGKYIFGLSNSDDPVATMKREGEGFSIRADYPKVRIGSRDSSTDWVDHRGEIHFAGTVSPGESVVFLGDAGVADGRDLSYALMWEGLRVQQEQMAMVTAMHTLAEWIEQGPTGTRALADRALKWQKGGGDPHNVVAAFTSKLSNGATVRVLAVAHPRETPFCWWTPSGEAVRGDWTNEDQATLSTGSAVVVEAIDSPATPPHPDGGWFHYDDHEGNYYGASHMEIPRAVPELDTLDVGVSVGPWHDVGVVRVKQDFKQEEMTVRVTRLEPLDNGKGVLPVVKFKAPADVDLRVIAVDKANKRWDERTYAKPEDDQWMGVLIGLPVEGKWRVLNPNIEVPPGEIDYLEVQTRKREWVHFEKIADAPAVPIPVEGERGTMTQKGVGSP